MHFLAQSPHPIPLVVISLVMEEDVCTIDEDITTLVTVMHIDINLSEFTIIRPDLVLETLGINHPS